MQPDDPQPQDTPQETDAPERVRVSRWAVFRSVGSAVVTLVVVGCCIGALMALFHPETPLPDGWNPTIPLAVSDPVTPLTGWKLRAALSDPVQCRTILADAATAIAMDPIEASDACHVRNRVALTMVGAARIDRIETACATALRMAMWEHHGLQPAAQEILGADVSVIRQIGSYNCRQIRTTSGNSTRWSTHATADAIDITGFDFTDGSRIRLISDWDGTPPAAQFLRAARDSACTWFATTLSPDFNRLHADHFHLQSRGWGSCR